MRALIKPIFIGLISLTVLLLIAGCSGEVNGLPEPRVPSNSGSVADGRKLIVNYGCGSCHTIPGIPGADSMASPPLDHFYQRMYIAGRLPNTWENLIKWIQDPQGVEPGTAMPNLGVSEVEARNIAAYLYHQPTIEDYLNP